MQPFSCDPPCVSEETEAGEMICVPKLSGQGGKIDVTFGKKSVEGKSVTFIVAEEWVTIQEVEEHHYLVRYLPNEQSTPRQAEVTFSIRRGGERTELGHDDIQQVIVVDQLPTPTLTIEPSADIEINYAAGDTTLDVSASESAWVVSLDPVITWLAVEEDHAENTLSVIYESNPTSNSRKTSLQVSIQSTDVTQSIVFTQEGKPSISASFHQNDDRKGHLGTSGTGQASTPTLFTSEYYGGQIIETIDISIQSKNPAWDVFLTAIEGFGFRHKHFRSY